MKNLFRMIIVALIFSIIGGCIYMLFKNENEAVGVFHLEDYNVYINEYIDNFPNKESQKELGKIDSYKMVKEKAEKIWVDVYGNEVKAKKPYEVFFDDKNQIWLVQGSLKNNHVGGVPFILIQKFDGKILAIWHTK